MTPETITRLDARPGRLRTVSITLSVNQPVARARWPRRAAQRRGPGLPHCPIPAAFHCRLSGGSRCSQPHWRTGAGGDAVGLARCDAVMRPNSHTTNGSATDAYYWSSASWPRTPSGRPDDRARSSMPAPWRGPEAGLSGRWRRTNRITTARTGPIRKPSRQERKPLEARCPAAVPGSQRRGPSGAGSHHGVLADQHGMTQEDGQSVTEQSTDGGHP